MPLTELTQVQETVRNVLSSCPLARNSDKWLVLKVWEIEAADYDIKDGQTVKWHIAAICLPYLTTPETITRLRRHIQNVEGKYLPTDPEVIKQRRIKEEKVREYFGAESKEYQELTTNKYKVQ